MQSSKCFRKLHKLYKTSEREINLKLQLDGEPAFLNSASASAEFHPPDIELAHQGRRRGRASIPFRAHYEQVLSNFKSVLEHVYKGSSRLDENHNKLKPIC